MWQMGHLRLDGLRGLLTETLTSASYLGLLLVAIQLGPRHRTAWLVCMGLVTAISLLAWALTLKRARAIAELATSRIGSAAQGYVELSGKGTVDPEHLINSPYSRIPCIWYRYTVYEKDGQKRQWRLISRDTSWSTFELKDGSGSCRVDPDNAEIIGQQRRTSFEGSYKQVEELLFGGSPIYVLGEFSTLGGANSILNPNEDVAALLGEWKRDPASLKQRFDLDRNGEIDLPEWELARRLAQQTVNKQHREIRNAPGVNVIRAPRDGSLFLIASMSPQKLRQRYLLWSAFHLATFVLATSAWLWLA